MGYSSARSIREMSRCIQRVLLRSSRWQLPTRLEITSKRCHLAPPAKTYSTSSGIPSTTYPSVFSGIQPTGVPHLGNYLGALRQWVDLQSQALTNPTHDPSSLIFSIVDLHALTGHRSSALL